LLNKKAPDSSEIKKPPIPQRLFVVSFLGVGACWQAGLNSYLYKIFLIFKIIYKLTNKSKGIRS